MAAEVCLAQEAPYGFEQGRLSQFGARERRTVAAILGEEFLFGEIDAAGPAR